MNPFFERYKKFYGVDLNGCQFQDLPKFIRLQGITIDELRKRLKDFKFKKVTILDKGYIIDGEPSPGATPEYLLGYYCLQEAAAQIPVQMLKPTPEEIVLDMCAAPGNKTIQLSHYMKNKGVIVALDINTRRLDALNNNIQRCGVKNVIIYNKDARYASDLNVIFDKVLLDAPCFGNFMTDKTWLDKRNLNDLPALVKVQKQMLSQAVLVVKKNGTIAYSTCSLEPEENEELIKWALDTLPVKLIEEKRLFPPKTQGFYIALLEKQ